MKFSFETRQNNLQKLKNEKFDFIIIGGGINGAGIARDAASRGLKVALVEADDFASGTSSRSSKLIHGGIRYLENFEFGLVFEALSERRLLFEMAPHLVHPLRFALPLYKGSRVGMFTLGLGMWLYDALSMFEAPQMHERLGASDTLERFPLLDGRDLKGSYVYSDAYMDDDRLVIETLRSAHSYGAVAVNYCEAVGSRIENNRVVALKVRDSLSNTDFMIEGRHIISTVGAWTDIVAPKILNHWQKKMRPSKGVHLTFSRSRIPIQEAVVMISDDEKRIVFAIPRHEMVIIGTTDTDFKGDPRAVSTSKEDVEYLLKVTQEYFPGAQIGAEDILSSYSGVRPLVHDGAESESKTSREHLILSDPQNVTFVMGGKYTTYRLIAEQAVEAGLRQLGEYEVLKFNSSLSCDPLNPLVTTEKISRAHVQAVSVAQFFQRPLSTVLNLIDRHGEEAFQILDKYNSLVERSENEVWSFEAAHAIDETMCLSLRDFYLRRAPIFLSKKDHGLSFIAEISRVFENKLPGESFKVAEQINQLKEHIQTEMSWK